jgi:hypothetical protein
MAKKRPAQFVTSGATQATNANPIQDQAVVQDIPMTQDQAPVIETAETPVSPILRPSYPEWPTSKRGPQSTPSLPGTRSINALRPEQFAEIGYNQETGEPGIQSPARSLPDENQGSLGFDQNETAQEAALRHKKERL